MRGKSVASWLYAQLNTNAQSAHLPEYEASPRCFTVWCASVRVGERHAFAGQSIDVGGRLLVRRYFQVPDLPVEVVSNDKQDIGRSGNAAPGGLGLSAGCRLTAGNAQENCKHERP